MDDVNDLKVGKICISFTRLIAIVPKSGEGRSIDGTRSDSGLDFVLLRSVRCPLI